MTLLEEDHPVSETYTTKNTDSQWSTDGHFTKECAHHVRVTLQQVIQYSLPPLSLSATCRVYRTISRASGLFNVVIQAEHNCVPPSDRRLRTSSLLTKKGPPHRGEARLTSGKKSFSVHLLLPFHSSFSPGSVKRKVQRIMAVLSLCKRGMGTPVKCLAFCDNEEKSKSLFHCGICTGTVHDHLKREGWSSGLEAGHLFNYNHDSKNRVTLCKNKSW